jgi:capsular exopolysaccharide synthesis family protein
MKTEPVYIGDPQHLDFEDDDEINLSDYLRVLSKYKWSILGFTLVVTLLASLYTFSLVSIYRATATILIETQEENVVSIEEVYGLSTNYDYFQTQHRILQSRGLSEKVIDALKIAEHPEFKYNPASQKPGILDKIKSWFFTGQLQEEEPPPPTEHALRNRIVGAFLGRLNVTPIEYSQLINISFESSDPELTAKVPNKLADIYILSDLEGRLAMTRKAANWITDRLEGLRQNVVDSEKALQKYRDKEKLIDVGGVDSLAALELDQLTGALVEARRNRDEAWNIYRQIDALKGEPVEVFESLPAVLKDPLVQVAKHAQAEAQRKVSELEKRYGPKHPKMIAARSELDTTNKNVQAQISNAVKSIESEYEVADSKVAHLSAALNNTKREATEINRKESQLVALERDVESNRNIYEMFLTRFKETDAIGDLQPANARIVDPAVIPSSPVKPDKRRIILIALFLSAMFATIIAFIIEALDNTLKDSHDVEVKLHLPVLGILPKVKIWIKKDIKAMRYYSDHNRTSFAENIRTVRSGILMSGLDEEQKVVMVTSAIPSEGKSITSVNLALAFGQMSKVKVLLIDADLRHASIGKVFGLDSKDIGLSHFMIGTHTLEQSVHHFEKEKIYIMPVGVVPPNPLEMISAKRFKQGLEALKKDFTHIVIDSAPTIAVSDALVLSQLVNEVIYVIKADDTPYQLAQEGIKRLRQVNAHIVGAVLNQINPSKKPGRYGYYYGDYYGYHGYKKS